MLSKQLQDQIEQEAEANTRDFKDNNDYQAGKINGYTEGYEAAAQKYAALYETAVARAERAEKALKNFATRMKDHCEKMGITSVVLQRITIDMEEYNPHP